MSKKVGVVIFNRDFWSDEGLAALQWASVLLKKPNKVHILLVNKEDGSGTEDFTCKQLSALVEDIAQENNVTDQKLIEKFDNYKEVFDTKIVSGRSYKGLGIQEILKRAINDFKLDTLVLGMAALQRNTSTAGRNDLLLNSECSVVLVKIRSQAPEAEHGAQGSGPEADNKGKKIIAKGAPSKTAKTKPIKK